MKFILFFISFILSFSIQANNSLISISFGDQNLGRSRVDLNLNDFHLIINNMKFPIKANFIKNSVQWVRDQNNLLIPRALISLRVQHFSNDIHVKYGNKIIIPEKNYKKSYFKIFINLFNPGDLKIFREKELIGVVTAQARIKNKNQKVKLIDYSCSKYNLIFEGLENEYMSVGCRLERRGKWGKETPRLEVTWSATNYQLSDGTRPPFSVFLHGRNPAKIDVIDQFGKKKSVTIRAFLPKRLHRLKTAFGFGPYMFEADSKQSHRKNALSPAAMVYGKLDLSKTSSFRGFNATVFKDSIFSNSGLYFAYQLADVFDGRIVIVPLLGLQGLYFKYNKNEDGRNKSIYPQGFEVLYKNAFGIENYNITYGTFLSTSSKEDYKNIWLRWGKGHFWELNYISWNADHRAAKMWGLSIGLPLLNFF